MDIGDDKELFEQAMSDEPAAVVESEPVEIPEEPQPEPSEPLRDESGRFARKEADEPIEPEAAEEEPPVADEPEKPQRSENRIPLAEHLSVRERAQRAEQERDQERQRREDLERRLQALERQKDEKPEEPAPDIWANPEAFIDQRLKSVQQGQTDITERVSRLLAVEKFGAEAVQTALGELERQMATNPGARFEHQRIMASEHPYGELVAWHKRQAVMQEIGEDPEAYKQRLRDELKNDPEFVKTVIETARQTAQPAKGAPQAIDLPPSLNRTTGSGGQVAPSAPPTEAEIFQEVFSR